MYPKLHSKWQWWALTWSFGSKPHVMWQTYPVMATCLQRWEQQGSWSSDPVSWAFFSAHFALAALEAEVLATA